MLKGIIRKIKSDKASSSIISFLLLVPLLLGVVITAVDMSFYFSNRSQVEAIAGDAARTVGIFGGVGDDSRLGTNIGYRYGDSANDACSPGRPDVKNAPNKYIFDDAARSKMKAVECNVLAALANSTGLTSFSTKTPVTVKCGPNEATTVGTRTWCEITYAYEGLPGAPLGFLQIRGEDGTVRAPLEFNKVIKSSESEVANPGIRKS